MNMVFSQEDLDNIARARAQSLAAAELDFDNLDINKDGEIDRNEVMKLALQGVRMFEAKDAVARDRKVDEFFHTFDTNGDGKIQKSEWLEFFAKLFDTVVQQGFIMPPNEKKLQHIVEKESQYKIAKKKEQIEKYLK